MERSVREVTESDGYFVLYSIDNAIISKRMWKHFLKKGASYRFSLEREVKVTVKPGYSLTPRVSNGNGQRSLTMQAHAHSEDSQLPSRSFRFPCDLTVFNLRRKLHEALRGYPGFPLNVRDLGLRSATLGPLNDTSSISEYYSNSGSGLTLEVIYYDASGIKDKVDGQIRDPEVGATISNGERQRLQNSRNNLDESLSEESTGEDTDVTPRQATVSGRSLNGGGGAEREESDDEDNFPDPWEKWSPFGNDMEEDSSETEEELESSLGTNYDVRQQASIYPRNVESDLMASDHWPTQTAIKRLTRESATPASTHNGLEVPLKQPTDRAGFNDTGTRQLLVAGQRRSSPRNHGGLTHRTQPHLHNRGLGIHSSSQLATRRHWQVTKPGDTYTNPSLFHSTSGRRSNSQENSRESNQRRRPHLAPSHSPMLPNLPHTAIPVIHTTNNRGAQHQYRHLFTPSPYIDNIPQDPDPFSFAFPFPDSETEMEQGAAKSMSYEAEGRLGGGGGSGVSEASM